MNWHVFWCNITNHWLEKKITRYKGEVGYRKLLKYVDLKGSVLEVGAGEAWISRNIRHCKTVALDNLFGVVWDNRMAVDHYVVGDVFQLPFRDKSFDIVLSCGLLEHFEPDEARKIVKEMRRVGRRVISWVPYKNLALNIATTFRSFFSYIPECVCNYANIDIGFKEKKIIRFFWFLKYVLLKGGD